MVGVPISHLDDDRMWLRRLLSRGAPDPQPRAAAAPLPMPSSGQLMARAVASVNTADFEGMPNVLLEAWAAAFRRWC